MAVQEFKYLKVSELPIANNAGNEDVLVINHDGVTSKIKFTDLVNIINSQISSDVDSIERRLNTVEGALTTLASTVSDNTGTINNIITAGFNLIGADTK